jgi:hypothetical protein
MKKIPVLFALCICFGATRAQSFFYIENNRITDNLIRNNLLKNAQFITRSPLSSDFIIKTEMNFTSGSNTLTLNIHVRDTATSQTVFQRNETLAFGAIKPDSRKMLSTVIQAFIDRNMYLIIVSARENHFGEQTNWLRARKDKT